MDQTEQCVICHQHNQQILMLTCVHDPCINCALLNYAKESAGKTRYNKYTCQICGQVTPLDVSSIVELQRMIPSSLKGQTQIAGSRRHYPTVHQARPARQSAKSGSPAAVSPANNQKSRDVDIMTEMQMVAETVRRQNSQNIMTVGNTSRRNGCREHEEDEVTYFCFGCLTTICPECAIHGSHQGHSVKKIKNAISDVKSEFLGIVDRVTKVSRIYNNNKDHLNKTLGDLGELHSQHRSSIVDFFQAIRKEICKKETELLIKLDQLHQSNLLLVKDKIEHCAKQKEESDRLSRSILNVLKKDDITVLQQFSKKTAQLKGKLSKYQSDPPQQKLEGLKTVNQHQLRDFTSEIAEIVSKLDIRWTELKLNQLNVRAFLQGQTEKY